MMFDILLKHAYVVTMDPDRRIIEDGAVGIEKGKIVFVGESAEGEGTVCRDRAESLDGDGASAG